MANRFDNGAEWGLYGDEANAREEPFKTLTNRRLFRGVKHDANRGQLTGRALKDSTERNCTNCRTVDLAEGSNDPSRTMWRVKHKVWLD